MRGYAASYAGLACMTDSAIEWVQSSLIDVSMSFIFASHSTAACLPTE